MSITSPVSGTTIEITRTGVEGTCRPDTDFSVAEGRLDVELTAGVAYGSAVSCSPYKPMIGMTGDGGKVAAQPSYPIKR